MVAGRVENVQEVIANPVGNIAPPTAFLCNIPLKPAGDQKLTRELKEHQAGDGHVGEHVHQEANDDERQREHQHETLETVAEMGAIDAHHQHIHAPEGPEEADRPEQDGGQFGHDHPL